MAIKIIIFLLLTGLSYSQVSHYSSLVKKRGTTAASHVTDSLKLYWLYSDLTDGDVATGEWNDKILDTSFTVYSDPNKGAGGVTFDGNDGFYVATPFTLTDAHSMELVVQIVDTATAQVPAGINDGTTTFTFTVEANANGTLRIKNVDGGGTLGSQYRMLPIYNTMAHLVATFDGDTIKVYMNGVLQTETGTTAGYGIDGAYIGLGTLPDTGGPVANGTIIKAYAIYNKELSQAEVTQNYNFFDAEIP